MLRCATPTCALSPKLSLFYPAHRLQNCPYRCPRELPTARLVPRRSSAPQLHPVSSSVFNLHSPASAANASGFILTALSNAAPPCSSSLCSLPSRRRVVVTDHGLELPGREANPLVHLEPFRTHLLGDLCGDRVADQNPAAVHRKSGARSPLSSPTKDGLRVLDCLRAFPCG